MTRSVSLKSRDGLLLESALDEANDARASLVLCHPHPKMGGTMNAPLILAIRDELVRRGWNVLRFNFRGIGNSEGASSTGEAEVADALGAVDLMREGGLPVAIAGWSFGAAVAIRVAMQDVGLIACVAIAPAIDEKPGITAGVPHGLTLSIPSFVVIGVNDDQVSPQRAKEWAEAQPGTDFVELKGANHFFWAKYDDLALIVADWLDGRL